MKMGRFPTSMKRKHPKSSLKYTQFIHANRVDMPPASAAHGISLNPDRGLGLSLPLGIDYENKKNKLRQELQLDYKYFVATKKDLKSSEPPPQPQGLSLPIDEKIWVQEKLREERSKEYNLFLQQQAQIRRLKRGTPHITSKPGQAQAADPVGISVLNTHIDLQPPPRERPASRRDAATLTEAVDNGKRMGTLGPGHQGRRRWRLRRLKEPYSSEEELSTDREEELKFINRRRRDRHTPEPEQKEGRRARECRTKRAPQNTKEMEAPGVHEHNNSEWVGKLDLQMPDSMRAAARSRPASSKDRAELATGLMIGTTEEQTASQMRKEQYRQELLKQIDEQQRNKIREKKLELRVAATGATDPEKEPDRIKQFGSVNRQYDRHGRQDVRYKPRRDLEAVGKDPNPRQQKDTPAEDTGKSHMDCSTALGQMTGKTVPDSETREEEGVPLLDYVKDYHRDFSNMLGDVAITRVAGVPPPVPPTVTNNYKTPYDAAYYYYGTRNPLDPNLPYNHNGLPEGVQQSGNFHSLCERPTPLRPSGRTEAVCIPPPATDQHRLSPLIVGELPADKAKQRRESTLSYQEALREQIKEREERKKREKEEKKQNDAKIEAEMMAYNPWGKSGGGAPIRDQKGNLVNDLNQMHRSNKESYRNPVSRNSGQTQSSLKRNGNTPGVEATASLSNQLSGFNHQPTTQQLHVQDRYKEDLKQQIEENKRKQEEERERMRTEEEKEEKRVADQRACMQQEYEEELRKQKKVNHRLEKQSWTHEPKTQHQEEEKKIKEREECKKREKEEKKRHDATIEAEMMAYNPWGKSGGGAPIRDQKGNLVNDLNQMHRSNKESYRNPVSRNSGQTQSSLKRNGNTPGVEAAASLSYQLSGFNHQPTTQQLHVQDSVKEDLKQQIEENKRKQEEERERMRTEEEKEEKRVADQRACMQQEYEEELRKQKKVNHRLEKQSWTHEPKTQHQEEEKKVRQDQEVEKKVPESARDREEKSKQWNYEREPSPPILTLYRKQTNLVASRPSTAVSQLSTRTEHSVSAPHYRPVPAKLPQLQDGQQEVIRELSTLRRYLRKEQRKLEVQLGQTDPQESRYTPLNRPRGRPRVDAFDSPHKQVVHSSMRSPYFGAACVNMQNIREFNQLKYRDTASREEVRHMYPDPPTDAQSLDIQQQALLREQQRKIRLMKREQEHDFLDQQLSRYHSRSKSGINRDSILPSETTFIDVYSGDACEECVHGQRSPEERTAPQRRHDYDEVAVSTNQRNDSIEPDAQSSTGLNLESKVRPHILHCITRQDSGGHDNRSEQLPDDEVDILSLRSALERRVSVDTVATEPWLRPGTSDAVKRSGCRETPNSRMEAPPWLTHRVT